MNILFDYQIFQQQRAGGISKYHADLYLGLQKNHINSKIGILYSDNIHLNEAGIHIPGNFLEEDCFLRNYNFKGKRVILNLMKKIGFKIHSSQFANAQYCRELIKNDTTSILHPTYYDDFYDDISIVTPVVITIHDMIYESYPHFFKDLNAIENKKKWAKRSQKIITISEYTKNEILKYYDFVKDEDIHVIYHGIDSNMNEKYNNPILKKDYLLFIGERGGYKDFYTLLKALEIVKKKNRYIKLYCVGKEFSKSEITYINFLNLSNNITNLGRVSDNKLAELYRESQMYISTSLSEGFGLPLLECMKYSTPMILSNIPVYNEIAGKSAVYFSPSNEYELADAINYVFDNSAVQNKLIERGNILCKQFTHSNTVINTIKVYNSLT